MAKDPQTSQVNRYEIALFDINNPDEKENLSRLEELYLKFNFKKSTFTLGKQLLNSSFINLQDGRMRPTEVAGIWVDFNELKIQLSIRAICTLFHHEAQISIMK